MDELLSEFLTECLDGMAKLDLQLVQLERCPDDPELVAGIFRIVHTIKGTCGFLGLPRLETVAHAAENVLGRVRDRELTVTPPLVNVILAAVDRIKQILEGLATNQVEPAGDDAHLIAVLNQAAAGQLPEASDADAATPVLPAAAAPAAPSGVDHVAAVEPAPAVPPSPVQAADELPTAAGAVPAPAGERGEAGAEAVSAQSLRVRVDVLEQLMNLVGELVLTRNQLLQIVRRNEDSAFKAPLQRLSQLTSELQEGVMRTRMQPIGNAWGKLPRLVRDLGMELGKQIELKMIGADTELDRQVLDLIKDPLTHMVRNSADHGIEAPAVRRAAGKPERGTITLQACHEGGHVVIRISDDGHGLDVERIRAKALANHLAGEHELAAMSREEILKFIFAPGFSTAAQVTNVSGRGVGMDVVRNNIEKIAGVIDLASEPGRGTIFTIKIPLTLAIVSVLIVSAAGERFAIPQLGVVELVRAGGNAEHRLEVIDGAPILRLRDRLLPVVSLARALEISDAMPSIDRPVYVVVTQIGASLVGILVDQVFDTEEIVVKPLAPILRNIRVFSGNTILGDGSVIMILDLNAVAGRLNLLTGRRTEAMAQAETATDETTTLLLFSAGGGAPKAVPLRLVTRLEEVAAGDVEWSGAQTVMQYRGQLMPLIGIDGQPARIEAGRKPVLVFHDAGRGMGLVVDEIIDITEATVALDLRRQGASSIGSAIIAGKATELIDIAHYVTLVFGGWFAAREAEPFRGSEAPAQKRILLVDDSAFFRNLLTPLLEANNYRVLAAPSAAQALQMRDDGCQVDAIISDIEMPGMDGFAFVEACRAAGAWREVPIIALTSHTTHRDVERGREAGFSDYVGKLDRGALLEALTEAQQLRGVA